MLEPDPGQENRLMKLAPQVAWIVVVFVSLAFQQNSKEEKPLSPINLAGVNTEQDEDDPHLSQDTNKLYYVSKVGSRLTLMVSERRDYRQPWPAGRSLEGPDPDTDNASPCLADNDHALFFATKILIRVPAGEVAPPANFDIVSSLKLLSARQFTAPTPVHAICSEEEELHPWVTADGQELYFSRKTKDGWRVFVASRPGEKGGRGRPLMAKGAFGDPKLVDELPPGFHHASLSRDGRTMYLQGPLDKGRWGLFRTTRADVKKPWQKPEPLDRLNHPGGPTGDMSPCLSRDGSRLYFASDRPGGRGGKDLWVIDTQWFKKETK
jgi:hypothetical protein